MNYQIITDREALAAFIEWLPDLEPHEKFYCCLFARSKYTKHLENPLVHIKSDKAQLKRFVAAKKDLFWKIQQLECPIGSYRQQDNPVPQEALALYISINPRDCYRAQFGGLTALSKCIQNQSRNANPHQEIMSEIQRTKSRSHVVTFDVDLKYPFMEKEKEGLHHSVNWDAVNIIETHGGYHIMVRPDKVKEEFRKTWYNKIKTQLEINELDQVGDLMSPMPGTYQGGFTPVLLTPFNHR